MAGGVAEFTRGAGIVFWLLHLCARAPLLPVVYDANVALL